MSSPTDRRPRSDSPMAIPNIPLHFDNSNAEESALRLVYELYPEWRESEGEVRFVKFTDGITNTLTKATKVRPGKTKSEIDREAVLMRAYGKDTEMLIDREREMNAHTLLASRGLAPALLARFNNGLLYKFIEGDACQPEDLRRPEVYRPVAKKLGEWHGTLPLAAISTLSEKAGNMEGGGRKDTSGAKLRPMPNVWTVMNSWIDALPVDTSENQSRQQKLRKELQWLEGKLGETPGFDGNDYVFAHCDLLSGNVILEPQPHTNGATTNGTGNARQVSFIDYEYATPAPAAFDLANHFAEWAGFECDHGSVPTKSQRRDFLRHYAASYRMHSITESTQTLEVDFHNDIEILYRQVDVFRGVPGFYWGIWALIQNLISQIDFDYASYAELRLGEYWAWKAELDGSRAREGRDLPLRERRWAEE